MEIDFGKIRPLNSGARLAFEELICQLARRSPPSGSVEFRRVEGAGGDGGVEAYWLKNGGAKSGFQAKYHLLASNIDWTKLDQSVKAALKNHPELDHYVVAVPCDLDDKTGRTAQSRTGWQQWETHKRKWASWAAKSNGTVQFEIWPAFELRDKLRQPKNRGIASYWFDLPHFDKEWFQRKLAVSIADLDDRYHAEDHVDLDVERVFDGLRRTASFRDSFTTVLNNVLAEYDRCLRLSKRTPVESLVQALPSLAQHISKLLRIKTAVENNFSFWDLPEWEAGQRQLAESVQFVTARFSPARENTSEENEELRRAIGSLASAIYQLQEFLRAREMKAGYLRNCLITGTSGTGKSHLLARLAEQVRDQEAPVVLLLGQYFGQGDPWGQILQRLDLDGYTHTAVLGALDAAAQATKTTGLIIIDALNEGAGLRLWKSSLAGLAQEVALFPNLTLVISCRSEYRNRLIPKTLSDRLAHVECRGFETPEDQEKAAKRYMDRHGIIRPAAPWLSAEFVNPLFLRSCCIALARNGKTEFPRGLQGTRTILRFYLDSISRQPAFSPAEPDRIMHAIQKVVSDFAKEMAKERRDNIPIETANQLVAGAFQSFAQPSEQTWLDVLLGSGFLRRDLNETEQPRASIVENYDEVVRFAFQRFADHLIAKELLSSVSDCALAFRPGGSLRFIVDGNQIRWEWTGVFYALAMQIPEKASVELIDAMQIDTTKLWKFYHVRQSFLDSLILRSANAFTRRTWKLFQLCASAEPESFVKIQLHLAATPDHPWNARQLHKRLLSLSMPDRDSDWAITIAGFTNDRSSPVNTLIEWARNGDLKNATKDTLELVALTLTWLLSTSSRPIRDRATKALTSLLLASPKLFSFLLTEFAECDDPYVSERVLAAGFGAATTGLSKDQHLEFATVTFGQFFEKGAPLNLLSRDYGLGIIEAAQKINALPSESILQTARSRAIREWPLEDVTKDEIEAIASKAGDSKIYDSTRDWGDFGHKTVGPIVKKFSLVPLTESMPLTADQEISRFEADFLGGDSQSRSLFYCLREEIDKLSQMRFSIILRKIGNKDSKSTGNSPSLIHGKRKVKQAEKAFVASLSELGRKAYSDYCRAALMPGGVNGQRPETPTVDVSWAQRWIAKRAYELGWNKERFRDELNFPPSDYISRPSIERIGKKYQWIALHELLAHLAYNVWFIDWDGRATRCESPVQIGFLRDIDPTILIEGRCSKVTASSEVPVVFSTPELPAIEEQELLEWPFRESELPNRRELLEARSPVGDEWLVLYDLHTRDEKFERPTGYLDLRRNFFTRVSAILIPIRLVDEVVASLINTRLTDPYQWEPQTVTDSGFLLEVGWRANWPSGELSAEDNRLPVKVASAKPIVQYQWESHLDASLPKGFSVHTPTPWLMNKLGLVPRTLTPGEYEDRDRNLVFKDLSTQSKSKAVVIKRDVFFRCLDANDLTCLWIIAGERNVWPTGSHDEWVCRYHSAICRLLNGRWTEKRWFEDRLNLSGGQSSMVSKSANSARSERSRQGTKKNR